MANLVLWSLAVEEHFYFLRPTVIRRISSSKLALICGSIILVSPISDLFRTNLAMNTLSSRRMVYYSWNPVDSLALGALMGSLEPLFRCTLCMFLLIESGPRRKLVAP